MPFSFLLVVATRACDISFSCDGTMFNHIAKDRCLLRDDVTLRLSSFKLQSSTMKNLSPFSSPSPSRNLLEHSTSQIPLCRSLPIASTHFKDDAFQNNKVAKCFFSNTFFVQTFVAVFRVGFHLPYTRSPLNVAASITVPAPHFRSPGHP